MSGTLSFGAIAGIATTALIVCVSRGESHVPPECIDAHINLYEVQDLYVDVERRLFEWLELLVIDAENGRAGAHNLEALMPILSDRTNVRKEELLAEAAFMVCITTER